MAAAKGRTAGGQFVGLKMVGDWKSAKEVLAAAPADLDQAMEAAVAALSELVAGAIKKKIGSGVNPPNSSFTILMKKSSKTLINKGDLRNAARAIKVGKMKYFVGIPAALSGGRGGHKLGDIVKLAEVLEEGRTIVMRMTDKMRKFLFATLAKKASKIPSKGGSTGILVIHIPPRPFIQPVFDDYKPRAGKLFEEYLLKNLKRLNKKPQQ